MSMHGTVSLLFLVNQLLLFELSDFVCVDAVFLLVGTRVANHAHARPCTHLDGRNMNETDCNSYDNEIMQSVRDGVAVNALAQ